MSFTLDTKMIFAKLASSWKKVSELKYWLYDLDNICETALGKNCVSYNCERWLSLHKGISINECLELTQVPHDF